MIVRPAATANAKIAEPKDQKEDAMRWYLKSLDVHSVMIEIKDEKPSLDNNLP